MLKNQFKQAQSDQQIHELIAGRWSPYAFDPRPVERDRLVSCLEAARWAASSYNEQPWSFIVAERDNATHFERMLKCLVAANQAWAKDAGVLMVTVICKGFARNGKPNRMAEHDLGLAVGNLSLQATSLGLGVHQMAGIDLDAARQSYEIPETHDPVTAIALGYPADLDNIDNDQLVQRERSPRSRKSLDEFVFAGSWKKVASL